MAPKFKRECPICRKPELLYLSDHLKQVHQLSSTDERQPWLKSAVFSSSKSNGIPYMPPFPFWGMRSIPQHSSDSIKPQPQQPRQPPRPTMKVQNNYCLETKLYPDFQFNYMFSMLVVVPTQCAKTYFVEQLLTTPCLFYKY